MPHAHALRSGRHSVLGQVYHVTCVTNRRHPVFSDFAAARLLILTLKAAEQRFGAHTLAFVLMPDHLHWLFELNSASLSELIRWVEGSSSRAINRMHGSSGTLWQAGFHDHALRCDEDLAQIAVILWPTLYVQGWFSVSAITRTGMRHGCEQQKKNHDKNGSRLKPLL